MTEADAAGGVLQDRALALHDGLDGVIEAADALAGDLARRAGEDRRWQRRAEHMADAARYLRAAKIALFRAGKE